NRTHCGFCGHACEDTCRNGYCPPKPFVTLPDSFGGGYAMSVVTQADDTFLFAAVSGYAPTVNDWVTTTSAVAWDGRIIFTTPLLGGMAQQTRRAGDEVVVMTTFHLTRIPFDGGGPRFDVDVFASCGGDPCGGTFAVGDDQIFFSRGNDLNRISLEGKN